MPELQESTRRWSGYVCPDCRFVFRVAREHDGRGVVCPSCKRLLKIPQTGDSVPPLLAIQAADLSEPPTGTSDEDGARVVRKRRKKRSRKSQEAGWETTTSRHRSSDDVGSGSIWAWMAGIAAVVVLAVVAVVFLNMEGWQDPLVEVGGEEWLEDTATLPEPLEVVPTETRRSDAAFVAEARPLVERFLNAHTVDAVLELVDQPEVVKERIARMHPDGAMDAPGLGEFAHFSQIIRQGAYGTLPVRTRDFEIRSITLRETPEGLKVDWESWVGWSDIPWETVAKAGEPLKGLFRVVMRNVEYYNFDFTDDRRWQSYRLDSPDKEHSLYGYVERDSLTHERLRAIIGEQREVPLMLELRRPESPQGRGQVVIERVASEDWIDPERRDEP